jgi:hypothetical protein
LSWIGRVLVDKGDLFLSWTKSHESRE